VNRRGFRDLAGCLHSPGEETPLDLESWMADHSYFYYKGMTAAAKEEKPNAQISITQSFPSLKKILMVLLLSFQLFLLAIQVIEVSLGVGYIL